MPRRMIAVMAEESRVADAIAPYRADVSIAAINGPVQVTISGRPAPEYHGFGKGGLVVVHDRFVCVA